MTATKRILKGQPIIVNYNEFSSSFFEENMPFLPRFTINIPPIPPQILASGKKSALAQLLGTSPSNEVESRALVIKQEPNGEDEEEGTSEPRPKRPRRTTDGDQQPSPPSTEVIVID
jgi:hypothetical protein